MRMSAFYTYISSTIFSLVSFQLGAPPPWHGLKMAIELSPVCPQNLPSLNNSQQHLTNGRYDQLKRLLRYLQTESEDCLFLNLYVPKWCKYSLHIHRTISNTIDYILHSIQLSMCDANVASVQFSSVQKHSRAQQTRDIPHK